MNNQVNPGASSQQPPQPHMMPDGMAGGNDNIPSELLMQLQQI